MLISGCRVTASIGGKTQQRHTENLWHEMKEFICREKTKDELIEGILEFWRTVDANKSTLYTQRLYLKQLN